MEWHVYDADGTKRAEVAFAEDAAQFVSMLGNGAKVRRWGPSRRLVWEEGSEEIPAGESFDRAAEIMIARSRRL